MRNRCKVQRFIFSGLFFHPKFNLLQPYLLPLVVDPLWGLYDDRVWWEAPPPVPFLLLLMSKKALQGIWGWEEQGRESFFVL